MGRPGALGKAYAALTATLAIGVAVLLLFLYMGSRDESRDEGDPAPLTAAPGADSVEETDALPPSSSDHARPAPSPSPSPAEPRPTPDSLAEDADDEEEPEAAQPDSDSTASFIEAQLARGRSELRRAAATCLRGDHSARDEDLFVIEYTLVGKRGAAGPADLEVLQSNIGDRDLEECIIEQINDVEWRADGPEVRVVVADSFTVGDLKKHSQ
jgi:hypothetical protein